VANGNNLVSQKSGGNANRATLTVARKLVADVKASGQKLSDCSGLPFSNPLTTFNRANPSQIQIAADAPVRFGTVTEVLPGREGQVGIKLVF
jgi:hypothetical protein